MYRPRKSARRCPKFLAGLLVVFSSPSAKAQLSVASDAPQDAVRARILVSEFFTADSVTGRNLNRADLRLVFDASTQTTNSTELHVDGRARFALDNHSQKQRDVTHLFVLQRLGRLRLGLGRINVLFANASQIDGAYVGVRTQESVEVGGFFGLAPHPITGALDSRFQVVGAGYQARASEFNHSGAARLQLYRGEGDRLALSEQVFWRASAQTRLFGRVVFDLLKPSLANETSLDAMGLTNVFFSASHRASQVLRFRLGASHVHTLVPNRWWADWVEEERARLGFSLDGPLPAGSRRSNARLATNFHLSSLATPYVALRYDYRHEDQASGYETRGGLKLNSVEVGYLDLFLAQRDYFGRAQQLGGLQSTLFLSPYVQLDAGMMALHLNSFTDFDRGGMLYDLNAGLWADLGQVSEDLRGVRVYGTYQAFIDPEMTFHTFFLRLSYNYASGKG